MDIISLYKNNSDIEHVSKEFDHALHWHRLYLKHGRPQSGFIFEMRKIN